MNYPDNCFLVFKASWCPPCQELAPILDKVKNTTGVEMVIYDIDEHKEEFRIFGVEAMPVVFLIKDGRPIDRIEGKKTEQEYVTLNERLK